MAAPPSLSRSNTCKKLVAFPRLPPLLPSISISCWIILSNICSSFPFTSFICFLIPCKSIQASRGKKSDTLGFPSSSVISPTTCLNSPPIPSPCRRKLKRYTLIIRNNHHANFADTHRFYLLLKVLKNRCCI